MKKNHQIQSPLIIDHTQSFWGEVLGSFIQPAQKKEAIVHADQNALKKQAEEKLESLNRKLHERSSEVALVNKWNKKHQQYLHFFDAIEYCSHDYFTITTTEGRVLDSVQISPSAYYDMEPAEQYYNVHLLGSKQMFGDRMIDLYREAHQQNVNVIAFDYSNIGYSTGGSIPCLNRMVADASAVVQCLLEQGVPANHIVLHGFSLGGLIGTILAAHCHQHHLPVNIYASCTPMELAPCIFHWLTFIPSFLQGAIIGLLNYLKWDTDVMSLWERIPDEYKEFSFIDIEDDEIQAADNFIPVSATIYSRQKLSDVYTPYSDSLDPMSQGLISKSSTLDLEHLLTEESIDLSEKPSFHVEVAKKMQIIDHSTQEHDKNLKTAGLMRYKDMLSQQAAGHHHRFYLDQGNKKKKNPHGTSQYLLFNKATQNTPEELFESFEAFVELRNQGL